MKVRINGQMVTLAAQDVIGTGGEASIVRWQGQAVKLYHAPDTERGHKLIDMTQSAVLANLPPSVCGPQTLVWNERNQLAGFVMKLLPPGYSVLANLANRNWRAAHPYSNRQIVNLFERMHAVITDIHAAGLIVGDLNDCNELFCGDEIAFVDVDSWQWGKYACMAATEAYCDPRLYGFDLTARPSFTKHDDWYSFATLLFKSLLGVHPYGGIHPKFKHLVQRAEQRVPVLAEGVLYPRTAWSPAFLSDELSHLFWQIFAEGARGVFPVAALQEYAAGLIECRVCHSEFPVERAGCPNCTTSPVTFTLPTKAVAAGVNAQELVKTGGPIVWHRVQGGSVFAIAHENAMAVLYRYEQGRTERQELFRYRPDARYEIFNGNVLVVSPDSTASNLILLELPGVAPITRTTTELLGGQSPMFGTDNTALHRVAGGLLMRGELRETDLVERVSLAVSAGQTWFSVEPGGAVFGYCRQFGDYRYFLVGQGDVELPPLETSESLLDITVKFDFAKNRPNTLLVARQTRRAGVDWLRLAVVDARGKVLAQSVRRLPEGFDLHSLAFANGTLLYPTHDGLMKENLLGSSQPQLLTATAPFVTATDRLHPFGNGLLIVGQQRVTLLNWN